MTLIGGCRCKLASYQVVLDDFVGTSQVDDGAFTPGVVGIPGDGFAVFIGNCDDIALQIFTEVKGVVVVEHTADAVRNAFL